jgi:hypothetical protein
VEGRRHRFAAQDGRQSRLNCQAKRKLNKGGLIVGDDLSWNASLWDFAGELGVPAYNFKGTLGVAFF